MFYLGNTNGIRSESSPEIHLEHSYSSISRRLLLMLPGQTEGSLLPGSTVCAGSAAQCWYSTVLFLKVLLLNLRD